MAEAPSVSSLSSPAVRGGYVQVIGTGFGRVASVAIVNVDTLDITEVRFQIDSGYSLHFTIPPSQPTGSYEVLVSTLDNLTSSLDIYGFGDYGAGDYGTVVPRFTLDEVVVPPPAPDHSGDNPIADYSSPVMGIIRSRLRQEVADYPESFQERFTADGEDTWFSLTNTVIDTPLTFVYAEPGQPVRTLQMGQDYQLDQAQGTIKFDTPPPRGTRLIISGTSYQFFTDAELNQFILSAALKHTHEAEDVIVWRDTNAWDPNHPPDPNEAVIVPPYSFWGFKHYKYVQQTVDTLPPVEYHLVALLASAEALETILTDASFDINVATAEGTSVDRAQRYAQISALIDRKKQQYTELAQQLGVGMARITIGTLRRISRTTGRLVPVYKAKEYDDMTLPRRVYAHIDSGKTGPDVEADDPYFSSGSPYP